MKVLSTPDVLVIILSQLPHSSLLKAKLVNETWAGVFENVEIQASLFVRPRPKESALYTETYSDLLINKFLTWPTNPAEYEDKHHSWQWRQLLVCQPPVEALEIVQQVNQRFGGTLEFRTIIPRPGGLRMGFLYDAIRYWHQVENSSVELLWNRKTGDFTDSMRIYPDGSNYKTLDDKPCVTIWGKTGVGCGQYGGRLGEIANRPMWALACTACEKDDVTLIDEAIQGALQKNYLSKQEILKLYSGIAIRKNSTKVLTHLIKHHSLSVESLNPADVAREGIPSKEIVATLLANGWDINARDESTTGPKAEPFLWHVVKDIDMVAWCLEHGASVHPKVTTSHRSCQQILEKAAASATVATFELLRSKGAPLGWRPLHRAVQLTTDYQPGRGEPDAGEDERVKEYRLDRARKYEKRMDMVRHLVDVVGIDVNALDQPPGANLQGRWGTPICYVPRAYETEMDFGLYRDTRELTWFLLDRGADPIRALELAKEVFENQRFVDDVEEWKAQHHL
ncbi:hypothetical protein O988_04475 [Pseudogymnoascus sp. VKM F-3808]|nr:hypothetical protein O988_04475 [Pseudogymnoascus sp. VKM F-3808]